MNSAFAKGFISQLICVVCKQFLLFHRQGEDVYKVLYITQKFNIM